MQIHDSGKTLFSKSNLSHRKAKTGKPYYLIKTGGIDTTGLQPPPNGKGYILLKLIVFFQCFNDSAIASWVNIGISKFIGDYNTTN
jgi:hypothetical protein